MIIKFLLFVTIALLTMFSITHAQYIDYFFSYELPIFQYETKVSRPQECSSFETYSYWTNTCSFKCYAGRDCEDKINYVNSELQSMSQGYLDLSGKEDSFFTTDNNLKAVYTVLPDERIVFSDGLDYKEFRDLWNLISYIIPDKISVNYLSEFRIYTDYDSDIIAYVETKPSTYNHDKYLLAINEPVFNSLSNSQKMATLIHELGHIISLNRDQYKPNIEEKDCQAFSTYYGCFYENSILNLFVYDFWQQEDLNIAYSDNSNLYRKFPDRYVTEYAATNEVEDFAETFVYFIMGKSASTNQAQEKINFLNKNKSMLKLKKEIYIGMKRFLTLQKVNN